MFKFSGLSGDRTGTRRYEDYVQASGLFRALGDVTRLRILDVLSGGEMRVHDIADALGMTQSAISHQLGMLKALRIVKSRREGRWIYYSLDDAHVKELFEQGMEHAGHP
jgi:ArsR family transcriptional regulator